MSLQSEYLAGTLGISAYFGMSKIKITQSDLVAADKFEQTIKIRAKQWVSLKKPAQPPKPKYTMSDYDNLLVGLDNPLIANPNLSVIPEEYHTDFIAKYIDIRSWLYDNQPALRMSGGLVAQELPASDSEKSKFLWSVNVLDDITKIFDLLDAGCITHVEATAMRDVYPEFILALLTQYILASIDYLYENEYSAISGWQMAGLSALAGVPVLSFQDVMAWQGNYQNNGPGRPEGSKAPNIAQSHTSDMQALGASV